jgi:hypothetical protein
VKEASMSGKSFDAFIRRAAADVSRRDAVVALGGAGLAAAITRQATAAKPSGKKNARKKCRRQVGQCRDIFIPVCGGGDECETLLACCSFLATCDTARFIACLGQFEF